MVPLVCEENWLALLQHADKWIPPRKPTLVISPHPDDETLGAGGLIAAQELRGVPVFVAAATDGEAAYPNSHGLAETRRTEQEQAVKQLGLRSSIIRLRLPDSSLSKHESDLEKLLSPLIYAGMLVVAPWMEDWHPDHEACARVTRKLCKEQGAELVSYLFWTWHRRTAEVFNGVHLLRFELSPALQAARKAALECHVSQLQPERGEPILPSSLLAPASRPFEIFISHV